MKKTVPCEVH